MVTLSNIKNEPFLYAQINNILTKEENSFLYNIGLFDIESRRDKYDDCSFFLLNDGIKKLNEHGIAWCKKNGYVQSNVGIHRYKSFQINSEYVSIIEKVSERLQFILEEYSNFFPKLYKGYEYYDEIDSNNLPNKDFREFHMAISISCLDSCATLYPHTDWIHTLKEENGINSLDELNSGRYKGVIYIGDDNLDYTNYGTRVYKSSQLGTEIEEIPFIPGNGIIFRSEENSYHGTQYGKNRKNPRITITFEYY